MDGTYAESDQGGIKEEQQLTAFPLVRGSTINCIYYNLFCKLSFLQAYKFKLALRTLEDKLKG